MVVFVQQPPCHTLFSGHRCLSSPAFLLEAFFPTVRVQSSSDSCAIFRNCLFDSALRGFKTTAVFLYENVKGRGSALFFMVEGAAFFVVVSRAPPKFRNSHKPS